MPEILEILNYWRGAINIIQSRFNRGKTLTLNQDIPFWEWEHFLPGLLFLYFSGILLEWAIYACLVFTCTSLDSHVRFFIIQLESSTASLYCHMFFSFGIWTTYWNAYYLIIWIKITTFFLSLKFAC